MKQAIRVLLCGLLAACGPAVSDPTLTNDPYESANRTALQINRGVDSVLWKPVAQVYDALVPGAVRLPIRNELNFLSTPASVANALLQGNGSRALRGAGRFFVNGTLGGLGLLDPATELGLPSQDEDFGQTLAVWGVPEGPYWVLPLLGPSTPRDALAKPVDWFIGPMRAFPLGRDTAYTAGTVGGNLVEFRAQNLDTFEALVKTSPDLYVTLRSIYRQKRNAAILNDETGASALSDIAE